MSRPGSALVTGMVVASLIASPGGAQDIMLRLNLAGGAQRPSGEQIVLGWLGSVALGFAAWRAFDEPNGQHSRVRDDWGYTPRAHTALAIGSFVGSTVAIWARGRARGANGTLLGTALGTLVPTVPVLLTHDDPLLPFMTAICWAPLQGFFGYMGYRVTARPIGGDSTVTVATASAPRGGSSSTLITRAEIAATGAATMFDVIQQLRPHWFSFARQRATTRSDAGGERAELLVYVDAALFGDVESLRSFATAGVQDVRFYDTMEATRQFGTGHTAGVIVIRLNR